MALVTHTATFDGKTWERIISKSQNVPWKETMGKYDVAAGKIAWSCKTKVKGLKKKKIDVVEYKQWQLGKRTVDDSDLDLLGAWAIERHNENVQSVLAEHQEFRSIVCIRNPKRNEFIIYEKPMYLYDPACYTWKKQISKKKNMKDSTMVIGTNIHTGKKELGISLVDNRLYIWDDVPADALVLYADVYPLSMRDILRASKTSITVVNRGKKPNVVEEFAKPALFVENEDDQTRTHIARS